ncbi:hypothetical protein U9M48_010871 [Paspalum notatum var. saurae]|uniref:Bifunctional inhibitor/plant lipid transfer protein/seed storage helical domain-containing protein n=1 Tax=Paspalum notatum var. saurae TaxID=547442 RepID=A0AAQ3WGR9_PASNO
MGFVHLGVRAAPTAAAVIAVVMMLGVAARADFAADRAECADQLMGLATCLTYVQDKATARAPTPDCCAGLKQVVAASKKCMCVLVKDRDEPALGFKINVTRAMDLPSLCNNPATFSDCPKILGMSPDAPEAAIFKEYARKHESNGTAIPAAATAIEKRDCTLPHTYRNRVAGAVQNSHETVVWWPYMNIHVTLLALAAVAPAGIHILRGRGPDRLLMNRKLSRLSVCAAVAVVRPTGDTRVECRRAERARPTVCPYACPRIREHAYVRGAAGKSSTSSAPATTGRAGAGGQPCASKLFFYLVSALLAFVSVVA